MQLSINPNDHKGLVALMDKHGGSEFPLSGKSEAGEDVLVSVFPDRITTETQQANGWCRINTYWRDGTTEETYSR